MKKAGMFLYRSIRFILFVALAVYFLLPTPFSLPPAFAQEEPNYDIINNIAEKMNCPTCTGINLADCRTQTCAQWKDQIKDLVDQGMSEDEVLDYFVAQYGTQVLQEPPKSGFTLTLWILPVAMILLGGIILFFTMRKWTSQNAEPALALPYTAPTNTKNIAGASSISDDYLSQVDKDLGLD